MGILERIEEKLDQIIAGLPAASGAVLQAAVTTETSGKSSTASAASNAPTAESAPVAPASQNAPATNADNESASADVELDASGLPWDARIHTKMKSKKRDNTWKNIRGVDKTLLAQVEAELREKYPVTTGNAPAAPAGDTPAAPSAPSAPAAPAAPSPPAAPSAPATGVDPNAEQRAKVVAEVQRLTDTHRVDYDSIVEVLETMGNAKTFEELKPEYYDQAFLKFKTWADWLDMIHKDIAKAAELSKAGVDVPAFCAVYGCKEVNEVHHEEVPDLARAIEKYKNDWQAYVDSQASA